MGIKMYDSKLVKAEKKEERQRTSSNLTGIPLSLKTKFEHSSGFSFDDVRVHYNSKEPAKVKALAYTMGNHVYVGEGQEKHLSHELGHVVQQKAGMVQPTTTVEGLPVNDDERLEQQADDIGKCPIQKRKDLVVQRLRIRLDNNQKENETFEAIRRIKINPSNFNENVSILEESKMRMDKKPLMPTQAELNIGTKEAAIENINDSVPSKRLQKHLTPNIPVQMNCYEKLCDFFTCTKDPYHGYGSMASGTYTLKVNEDIILEGHGGGKGIADHEPKELAEIAYNIIKKCGYTKENPWKGRIILFGCEGGKFAQEVADSLHTMTNFKIRAMGPDREFGVLLGRKDINYCMGGWNDNDIRKPIEYKNMNNYYIRLCKYFSGLNGILKKLNEMLISLKTGRNDVKNKKSLLSNLYLRIHSDPVYKEKQQYYLEYLENQMPNRLKENVLRNQELPDYEALEQKKMRLFSLKKAGKKQGLDRDISNLEDSFFSDENIEELDREAARTIRYKITNISLQNISSHMEDEIINILDYLNCKTQTMDCEDALGRLKLIETDLDTIISDYFNSCGVRINFDTEEGIIKKESGEDV